MTREKKLKQMKIKANEIYSITIAYWNSKNPQSGIIDEYQLKGLHNTLCPKMTQHQVKPGKDITSTQNNQ